MALSAGAGGLANVVSTFAPGSSGLIVGGDSASSNPGGQVAVTNTGTITTGDGAGGGNVAIGIVAQSIGGGGGSAGGSDAAAFVGDSGGAGGAGGNVSVTNAGAVTTKDTGAIGILAQSIGGGGGNGANAAGIFVAVGGEGGSGGGGGAVTVSLNPGAGLTTSGDFAAGVIAQSVGGGGGNGGYATSWGPFVSASVGGVAGGGGAGGQVTLTNEATLTTTGEQSLGILAQSIGGGGGGNGGAATAYSEGLAFSSAIALGGTGGDGGNGGTVTVNNTSIISTTGPDSSGVVAQSIGAGGGEGGAATAKALALGVPDIPTLSFTASLGATGGSGGAGGSVSINNAGSAVTTGSGAYGLLAQSIGGGGGNGGDSTATAYAIEDESATIKLSVALDFSLTVGGAASAAGAGNLVSVTVGDQIVTTGARSMGVVAQSIGGGGGYAPGAAQTLLSTTLVQNPGSNTGTGGWVNVTLQPGAGITTTGAGAWGILAQSIGGGGGFVGDPSLPMPLPVSYNAAIAPAGSGNAYADTVAVNVYGNITTTGANAHGIFAQSIGGGGGIASGGGNSTSASLIAGNSVGGPPVYWGNGAAITITQYPGSIIKTSGQGSTAIVAQSSSTQSSTSIATSPITVTIGGTVIGGTNGGQPVPNGFAGAAGIPVERRRRRQRQPEHHHGECRRRGRDRRWLAGDCDCQRLRRDQRGQ